MYVLVTYDVSTVEAAGNRRLRQIAKICVEYGQRVQNSVFECEIDPSQYEMLKHRLLEKMDASRDNIRFYNLGKNWHRKVEQFGVETSYDPEGFLLV